MHAYMNEWMKGESCWGKMLSWGGGKSSKFIRNGIRSLRAGVIIVEWLKWEVCESMGGKVKEKLWAGSLWSKQECRENDCQVKHRRLCNRSSLKIIFLSLFHIIPFFTPSCSSLAFGLDWDDNGNRRYLSLSAGDHEKGIFWRFLMIFLVLSIRHWKTWPLLLGMVVWMLYLTMVQYAVRWEKWSQLSKKWQHGRLNECRS